MSHNTDLPRRKYLRLRSYDYASAGGYFVTICTHQQAFLFGAVQEGVVSLNNAGRIVEQFWEELPQHYPTAVLDSFVIMPNHVHGILFLQSIDEIRSGRRPDPTGSVNRVDARSGHRPDPTLSDIIRSFKTFSANRINKLRDTTGQPLWQRSYFERIIRNERELNNIRQYISDNPVRWEFDWENPDRIKS